MSIVTQQVIRVNWEGDGLNEEVLRQIYTPYGLNNLTFEKADLERKTYSAII
ncbi:MAG: hypothetical protein EZS28_026570, partial [Streblomastix strix]